MYIYGEVQRLLAFQACDSPQTFNAWYRSVRYSLPFYYVLRCTCVGMYIYLDSLAKHVKLVQMWQWCHEQSIKAVDEGIIKERQG